eukprot:s1317_g6.t1
MEEDSVGLAGLTELSFEAVQSLSSQWVQGQVFSEQVVQEHGKAALDFLECQWAVQGGTQEEAALDTICPVVGKPERSSVHLRFYLQEVGTASIPRRDGEISSEEVRCTYGSSMLDRLHQAWREYKTLTGLSREQDALMVADEQAKEVLGVYLQLAEDELCLPIVPGRKSNNERFAGAAETYTIEALTPNGMAIQAGTSHFLGQNFAKAFDVTYSTEDQTQEYVWASSWGVSTRLIGAVIMVHSDDDGLVLPPALAATQVVVLPLFAKDPDKQAAILEAAAKLRDQLSSAGLRVHVDDRLGLKPGKKFFEWERRGVPLRLELGPRDLESGTAMGKLRTGGDKFKVSLGEGAASEVQEALQGMKKELQSRSEELKQRLTFRIESRADFDARLKEKTTGMLLVPWGGDDDDEDRLQEETGVTLRCYPMQQEELPPDQVCPLTGKPSRIWAIFALAY